MPSNNKIKIIYFADEAGKFGKDKFAVILEDVPLAALRIMQFELNQAAIKYRKLNNDGWDPVMHATAEMLEKISGEMEKELVNG